MRVARHTFFLLAAAFGTYGCQAPPRPQGPTTAVWHVRDVETFLDDSLSVLRECDLPPARVERANGHIVTHPTVSAQWFEWWRSDARGGYQLLESSLHTIRRTVDVRIEPAGAGGASSAYRVSIEVEKERLSAPQRQITTASGALSIYNERIPTDEGLRQAKSAAERWVPLGRDVLLEEHLLARLAALPQVQLLAPRDARTDDEP
jgi:hypothetical protein